MSAVQRIFQTILPRRWAESMEADSRRWVFHCKHCGRESSIWDIGGIRWKAIGRPYNLLRCPNCGRMNFTQLRYRAEA